MKLTYYIPIYSWGENPKSVHGNRSGTQMYSNLIDLYGFENQNGEVIGYYEVSGIIPTQEEFEKSQK